MKVATTAYDKNSILAAPPKFYNDLDHPDLTKFTTEGGYWHRTTKYYTDERTRDTAYASMLEEIRELNGTAVITKAGEIPDSDGTLYHYADLYYVIEEPDHVPFSRMAATADRIGIDPDFEYPYDGVAELGPKYQTPRTGQIAYMAAVSGIEASQQLMPSALPRAYDRDYLDRLVNQNKVESDGYLDDSGPRRDEPQFGESYGVSYA